MAKARRSLTKFGQAAKSASRSLVGWCPAHRRRGAAKQGNARPLCCLPQHAVDRAETLRSGAQQLERAGACVTMAPKKKKDDKKGSGGAEEAKARPATAPVKAAEPPPEDVEDESEEAQETGTKRDGADVSKVTDYVEQEEMDHAKASKAIAALTDSMDTVDREAEAKREKELAAVKINQVRSRWDVPMPAT